jgi:hypothetical protein
LCKAVTVVIVVVQGMVMAEQTPGAVVVSVLLAAETMEAVGL